MSARFEELDRQATPIGEVSLRRRFEPSLEIELYEVKLDDEYLMSSLFTVTERELARLALAELPEVPLDVAVGGLGLGYTARAVLDDPRVRSLHVVELLAAVIGWHQRHLLPLGAELTADPRCRLVNADFFATVAGSASLDPEAPARWHAILVDIDHSPRHHLHNAHDALYQPAGLERLTDLLHPGGVFALWSDDPPGDQFIAALEAAFSSCEAHVVSFANPYTDGESACTVYTAITAPR